MTISGMQEVVKFISSSHTLQSVALSANYLGDNVRFTREECDYHHLVEAALSSSTIKSLEALGILHSPFRYSGTSQIEEVNILLPTHYLYLSSQSYRDCLCSIADMCKIPSLKRVTLGFGDGSNAIVGVKLFPGLCSIDFK